MSSTLSATAAVHVICLLLLKLFSVNILIVFVIFTKYTKSIKCSDSLFAIVSDIHLVLCTVDPVVDHVLSTAVEFCLIYGASHIVSKLLHSL